MSMSKAADILRHGDYTILWAKWQHRLSGISIQWGTGFFNRMRYEGQRDDTWTSPRNWCQGALLKTFQHTDYKVQHWLAFERLNKRRIPVAHPLKFDKPDRNTVEADRAYYQDNWDNFQYGFWTRDLLKRTFDHYDHIRGWETPNPILPVVWPLPPPWNLGSDSASDSGFDSESESDCD